VPEISSSMIGRTVSHYTIMEKLGGGGMGVVYLAEDIRLRRKVALKFLPHDVSKDPAALDRFEREAQAASQLNHPNICTVYDFGDADGAPFIAMELLRGFTLKQRLYPGNPPLATEQQLEIGILIADALDAAHCEGILHRDIKPGNIFITDRGQIKVLDFGLAKQLGADSSGNTIALETPRSSATDLTTPGNTPGTVAYMSPEQVRGEKLDSRSDLFSFGLVLYELATGKQAFTGATSGVIFGQILEHDPARPTSINPAIPLKLEEIIGKALEKNPKLRYQTAREMNVDLQRVKRDLQSSMNRTGAGASRRSSSSSTIASGWGAASGAGTNGDPDIISLDDTDAVLQSGSTIVSAAKQHKGTFVLSLFVVFAILALAGYGVFSFLSRKIAPPFSEYTISEITRDNITVASAISPDAKYVLTVKREKGQESLWLHHLPTASDTQIIAPADAFYASLDFSPDGNHFYFRRAQDRSHDVFDLMRAPALGGTPHKIAQDVDSNVMFSPDGSKIAFIRQNDPVVGKFQIITASPDGSNQQLLLSAAQNEFGRPYPDVAGWSPDGSQLLITVSGPEAAACVLVLVDANDGKVLRRIPEPETVIEGVRWMPNGRGIIGPIISHSSGYRRTTIAYIAIPSGAIKEVTRDTAAYATPTISADGATLAAISSSYTWNIFFFPSTGEPAGEHPEGSPTVDTMTDAWAFDGGHYRVVGGALQHVDKDNRGATTLISDPRAEIFSVMPCSPRYVFFTWAGHSPNQDVWRINTDGTNLTNFSTGQNDVTVGCSPDGKFIFFGNMEDSKIFRTSIDGGTPSEVTNANVPGTIFADSRAGFSPDGKWMALHVTSSGSGIGVQKIALVDWQSSDPPKVFAADPRIAGPVEFSPDGKSFLYMIQDKGIDNAWLQPVEGSTATQAAPGRTITHFDDDHPGSCFYSPDRKQLACERNNVRSDAVLFHDSTVVSKVKLDTGAAN
jgi:serine/threonine protein kinase/Tol biopolymer transport system component